MEDFSKIVQEQGVSVTKIEQNSESTHENVGKANAEIDKANENARSRNRTKRWCLLILLLIVVAVVIIIVVVVKTTVIKA
jgi:syntaxin 1B/2/3